MKKALTVILTDMTIQRLDQEAEKIGNSRNDVIRQCIFEKFGQTT